MTVDEAKKAERERCASLLEREADKLEREGSPTTAMIVRDIAKKIKTLK